MYVFCRFFVLVKKREIQNYKEQSAEVHANLFFDHINDPYNNEVKCVY